MSRIIGIDLGTTNSLVSVWENGRAELIPNSLGKFLTPSIVSFDKGGVVYIGEIAKERMEHYPQQTVASFKRFMGMDKVYKIGKKQYRPEELSALVLKKLKEDAEAYLGEPINEAVISVPAYFNDMARKATRNAGIMAGLKVERIINEPSAAALACQNIDRQEEATVLVFDMGGGTLDISIVDVFENIVEITAISGDNRLGGNDFDRAVAEEFCSRNNIVFDRLSEGQKIVMLNAANDCKQQLTENEIGTMRVVCSGRTIEMELSRKELISISSELFIRIEKALQKVLKDSGIAAAELSRVILVGGSCKMPVIQKYIQHLLQMKIVELADPDHMIAKGMGTYAGIKERKGDIKDMLLTDICPFSLGTAVINENNMSMSLMSVIIERNTALPASRQCEYCTSFDGQTHVDVEIYQGEEYYANYNIKLGKVRVRVPKGRKNEESINVRYTYDINGILVVDVTVNSTGKTTRKLIVNNELDMSDAELDGYIKKLENLTIHPRDKEENKLLLTKGSRLYEKSTGELRRDIFEKMQYFEHLLAEQKESELRRFRKYFTEYLERVSLFLDKNVFVETNSADFEKWYSEEHDTSKKNRMLN